LLLLHSKGLDQIDYCRDKHEYAQGKGGKHDHQVRFRLADELVVEEGWQSEGQWAACHSTNHIDEDGDFRVNKESDCDRECDDHDTD